MIDTSKKQLYGLLGKNISYSLSPGMHNAAFKHFDINAEYKLFDTDNINVFFQKEVSSGKISGFNVTVPYKIDIYDKLKAYSGWEVPEPDSFLGAINTVNIEKGKLTGYNTDSRGFYYSLISVVNGDPETFAKDKNIFIFGSGGAGRAIALFFAILTFKEKGFRKVNIYDADKTRLTEVVDSCKNILDQEICTAVDVDDIQEVMKTCDIVVNATPLGTKEGDDRSAVPLDCLKEGMVVCDLIYARETALIKAAKEKGLVAVNGLGMLVNQAALAFQIWTGKPFAEVRDIMWKATSEETEK